MNMVVEIDLCDNDVISFSKRNCGWCLGSNPQMPPPDIAMLQHKNISNFDAYHDDDDNDDDKNWSLHFFSQFCDRSLATLREHENFTSTMSRRRRKSLNQIQSLEQVRKFKLTAICSMKFVWILLMRPWIWSSANKILHPHHNIPYIASSTNIDAHQWKWKFWNCPKVKV